MPVDNPDNPYLSDPDVLLMLEFQGGEKTSFEKLLQKYYPRILNFIFRNIGNRATAEELTQEVFIKVYQSYAAYQPQAKFQTWLFTIAKNMSLNELRKMKRKMISIDDTVDSEEGSMPKQLADDNAEMADEAMIKKEKIAMIKNAIHDLPENQRTAVLLRRYENFSYEEIAETMNTSVKAVKSLLSRAKENLRNKLVNLIE